MTDHAAIIAAYQRHEKNLGGPDMVREAISATAEELSLPYTEVFEFILHSHLMAGNVGRG